MFSSRVYGYNISKAHGVGFGASSAVTSSLLPCTTNRIVCSGVSGAGNTMINGEGIILNIDNGH